MNRVIVAGVGITHFGKHLGRGVRSLAVDAIDQALEDSGANPADISRVYFGNAVAGIITQQEMIRGQVALRHHTLANAAIVNIENACASGGSALSLGSEAIASGAAEAVMVVGAEQLNHSDRSRPFNALRGSTDIGEIGEAEAGSISANSLLMDYYAAVAQQFLDDYKAEPSDFARVAVKNRAHAAHNPIAHLRTPQTVEDVINARMIVSPLTLPMCSPTTDGGAAILLCSEDYARRCGVDAIELVTSQIGSGARGDPVAVATRAALERAGMAITEFDVFELHDAAAPAELMQYAEIGLCAEGEGHHLVRAGVTALGGRYPVNPSGGLLSRGHPLGATGCAQVVELATQLRGRANGRQVEGARAALAVNGGGWLDGSYALAVATVLRKG